MLKAQQLADISSTPQEYSLLGATPFPETISGLSLHRRMTEPSTMDRVSMRADNDAV